MQPNKNPSQDEIGAIIARSKHDAAKWLKDAAPEGSISPLLTDGGTRASWNRKRKRYLRSGCSQLCQDPGRSSGLRTPRKFHAKKANIPTVTSWPKMKSFRPE